MKLIFESLKSNSTITRMQMNYGMK
uniref:Uncharacterized protein n=1 Tax=Arcella intermedia TaxID=1963864 RepID=A0A6B2LR19_9EUKA